MKRKTHIRRTRDKDNATVRGKERHVNDLHDRCELMLWLEVDGDVFPETNSQRRRRIHYENSADRPDPYTPAYERSQMTDERRSEVLAGLTRSNE